MLTRYPHPLFKYEGEFARNLVDLFEKGGLLRYRVFRLFKLVGHGSSCSSSLVMTLARGLCALNQKWLKSLVDCC